MLKLIDITTAGWYWWRWYSECYWEPAHVKIVNGSPQVVMPAGYRLETYAEGEFLYIENPADGTVGQVGYGVIEAKHATSLFPDMDEGSGK